MVFMPKGSVALWDWFYKSLTGRKEPRLTK
jgi:hypothetical protein